MFIHSLQTILLFFPHFNNFTLYILYHLFIIIIQRLREIGVTCVNHISVTQQT